LKEQDIQRKKPGDNVLFSEIKTKRGRLSKLQEYRIKELNGIGFNTEVYGKE